MRFSIALVPFLAILGCKGGTIDEDTDLVDTDPDADADTDADTDSDTDTDTDTDTDADCDAQVETISPIDNATNIAVDTTVEVTFSDAVADGQWSLEIDGVPGAAELAGDGMSATFTPTADLATDTEYTVNATACADDASADFRTVAAPLDGNDLIDRTYALEYATATWEAPAVISYFSDQIEIEYILTQILAFDASTSTLDASGAIGVTDGAGDIAQATCYEPLDFQDGDFSGNPTFVVGPKDLIVPIGDPDGDGDTDVVTMEDFTLTATFNADGSALEDISITGNIDTRPLDDATGQDICTLSSYLGDNCVACNDGVEECLAGWLTADEAPWIVDLDIDELYDPTTDATCAP